MGTAPITKTSVPVSHGTPTDREPSLDGIRGLAILLVLGHHIVIYGGMARDNLLDRVIFTFGASAWLGVDLFFVLSGFLITGILYDARSSPRYFSSFYGRRVLRIFPLYYGFLVLTFLVVPLGLSSESAASLTDGQAWYWLYLSNVQVALWGWQEPLHLGHFWSLAVEEQFYLLWPFVVRSFGRRGLMHVTVICFGSAFVLRMLAPYIGLSAVGAHVLMPTRIDALAAGAFLALASRTPGLQWANRRSLQVLVGCVLGATGLFLWRRGFGEADRVIGTVGMSVFAVGFAAMIAVALTSPRNSFIRRCLGGRPLTTLGRYSYGIYVFHQPVALLLHDLGLQAGVMPRLGGSQVPGIVLFALIVGGTSIGCALLSWHLWEQPFLRLKRHFPYQPPVIPAGGGGTPAILASQPQADRVAPPVCRDVRQ